MRGAKKLWTAERIETELRGVAEALGSFPTTADLRATGRNDLSCAVTKAGGLIQWAERLGFDRKPSDSDFGWEGEKSFASLCTVQGLSVERSNGVKAPWDMTINGALRIDVKTARWHVYRVTGGWHFRVGKRPQADVVVLYQADRGDFYGVPWWACPTTNITLMESGGKYAPFKNNWDRIKAMLEIRQAEMAQQAFAEVA
jgi:hypothetical protein